MKRLFALVLVSALVAACGSDDESSAVASLSGETDTSAAIDGEDAQDLDAEAAVMALTECLREQGVDIDDPTVDADGNVQLGQPRGGEDGVRGALRGAFDECQEFLEGVTLGFGRGAGGDPTEFEDTLLEFAACMRDNGIDMPDPDFSATGPEAEGEGGGPGAGPFGDIDRDDPEFQAAQEACQDILAGFGPGGGRLGVGAGGGDDG